MKLKGVYMFNTYSKYHLDVVFCIDKTGGMLRYSDIIKEIVSSLPERFEEYFSLVDKPIEVLRAKIIAFGDYAMDEEPMMESDFFVLPDQTEEFNTFLDSIVFYGGGDLSENGFEALATAIKSDWTTGGDRQRHIIMMFSDGSALPLGERADCPNYPKDLPKNMDELSAWWHGTDESFKGTFLPRSARFLGFLVDDGFSWNQLEMFDRTIISYNEPGSPECDECLEMMISCAAHGWC